MGLGIENKVLAVAGRPDMPVCAGIGLPLIRPPFTAPETHGDTGLGSDAFQAPG